MNSRLSGVASVSGRRVSDSAEAVFVALRVGIRREDSCKKCDKRIRMDKGSIDFGGTSNLAMIPSESAR